MPVPRPAAPRRALRRGLARGLLVAAVLAPLTLTVPLAASADSHHLDDRDGASGAYGPEAPPRGDGRDPLGTEVADPHGPYGSTDAGGIATASEGDNGDNGDDDGDDDDGDDADGDALPLRPSVVDAASYRPSVRIYGGGWGHGVGMSQYGAYAMALAGHSAEEILTTYYPGSEVVTDDAASTSRIRAGIRTGQDASFLEASDATVSWYACGQAGSAAPTSRVDEDDCEPWFDQDAGTVVQAVPGEDGGIEVEREVDGSFEPWQATDRPVARAVHGDDAIRAQSQSGQRRDYRFGWRDFHHLDDGLSVVQDVDSVEHYLRGLAEVPNSWGVDGPAATRAQAITGRTFALRRLAAPRGGDCACDLLSTPADQVFIGEDKVRVDGGELWADAVADSADEVLLEPDGALAETFYSSSHGLGRSESIQDSWAYGTTAVPYLQSIDDPWSADPAADNPRARWLATADNRTVAEFLSAGRDETLVQVERLRVVSRTDGQTPREVEVSGVTEAGDRDSFVVAGRPDDPKPITGASMRRFLPIQAGGLNQRLYSSQIERFAFGPFDDTEGHVHEFTVSWAQHADIVGGFDEDTFGPDREVTRAQLATYLVNTFDLPVGDPEGVFFDVPADHTHAESIEAIAAAGVADGFDDGSFGPDLPVTRQQMASLIADALALSSDNTGTFDDVSEDGVHAPNVAAIAEAGITQGCADARFCPADPVSRGQLASFVHRIVRGATS